MSAQVARLRRDLDATVDELKITPAPVKRLVDTALELDHEQPLKPVIDERELAEGLYEVPALTKSWARATQGLLEKLEREGQEPRRRPVTFDQATARGRHDIVLAHLGHPLVDMSARLLRATVWSGQTGLHRVTAVVSDDPAGEHTLAGAYSRFVAVGADGIRLHEEVLYAGGWLRDDGTARTSAGPVAWASMSAHSWNQPYRRCFWPFFRWSHRRVSAPRVSSSGTASRPGGKSPAGEAILVASEFAANSVLHSASRYGGAFILRAEVGQDRLRIEVEDAGGPWRDGLRDDGRPHGFDVVAAIAGAGNWGVDGDPAGASPGPGSAGETRVSSGLDRSGG